MRKLQVKHWQQPVIAGLGAWFAVSPWLLRLQADTPVAATSVILGLALIANAILSIVKQRPVDDWVSASLGLLTAVVPWLAQFASDRVATHNAEAVGLLTLLLALWALAQQGELGNRARAMLVR